MPQDKRRSSIGYRSFVTCDDPKGIVECGAIRKTKISSPQKREQTNKIEGEKRQGNQTTSLGVIKEGKKEMGIREITREVDAPASFHLLEVSKETEKLNHVINTWSNGHRNKDIAKDLLRGALDLQESLAMLSKLQEASDYVSGLRRKQKQKQKLEEGRFDAMVNTVFMESNRLGYSQDERFDVGCERPRLSEDGSSKKSFDEMRKVVRDSLLRQNVMVTNPVFEEEYHDCRKPCSPDMPSTSSSQSSMVHSSYFAPSESSMSSLASQKRKKKESNLIVKLMGLESLPSSPRRHREEEKILNLSKPVYDIDSPRARKAQFANQEFGRKQRTVDEILETLNFKGLLRSPSVNGLMPDSPRSEVFSSGSWWDDEGERPPIVVMKPIMPKSRENCAVDTKGMLVKPEFGRGSDAANFSEKCKEVKKVASSKERVSVKLNQKPQKKQATVRNEPEVVKVPPRRKGEEKRTVVRSDESRSRDQAKMTMSKVKKQRDEVFIPKNQIFSRQKTASTSIIDYRSSQGSSHREKIKRPTLTDQCQRHKGESKEIEAILIEEIDSTSENESVLSTIDSIVVDPFHSEKRVEASQIIQITDYEIDDQSSLGDAYPHNDRNISVSDAGLIGTKGDSTGHLNDDQSSVSDITSAATTTDNAVNLEEHRSLLPEVTLTTTHENGVSVHIDSDTDHETHIECATPRTRLKAQLLNSPSFLIKAEELFNLQIDPDSFSHEFDGRDTDKLLLDCANELMELTSIQFSQLWQPLYSTKRNLRELSSLERLMEEICNVIEELRCYQRLNSDICSSDSVYLLLERDLKFTRGTWEVGWRSTFSKDDFERVVGEIDKLVLSKLVEEVLAEFML